jgi:c-di-GMP-binding flagellar brake protein YcgR
MAEYQESNKSSLSDIEEQEKYLIHRQKVISRILLSLSKRPDIITAYFDGGSKYILTAVLAVLSDREMLVLDVGPNDALNKQLLQTGRATCVTRHDHIAIRFAVEGLERARYQGQAAFVAPLPKSLFRLQRREFFRVSIPVMKPVSCICTHPTLGALAFEVFDISAGGVGLVNTNEYYTPEVMEQLESCALNLPDQEPLILDLEVRNSYQSPKSDGTVVQRVGCIFRDLDMRQNTLLQRYITRVQLEQKALSKELD